MTPGKALLQAMQYYEETGTQYDRISDIIGFGLPLDEAHGTGKTIIEHLAVCELSKVSGALERRLELIEMMLSQGVEIRFNVFGLVDCAHVKILYLLLSHGADSQRPDELYRALLSELIDYAECFLRFANQRLSVENILNLQSSENNEVVEWIQKHAAELNIN